MKKPSKISASHFNWWFVFAFIAWNVASKFEWTWWSIGLSSVFFFLSAILSGFAAAQYEDSNLKPIPNE